MEYELNQKVDQIIVVNNGGQDETALWLAEQNDITTINQENTGGAGGFKVGIKEAYEIGFDWIWCLDQDIESNSQTLSNMIFSNACKIKNTGFLSSVVLNENKQLVYINIPLIEENCNVVEKIYLHSDLPIISCSFSSVLINSEAIKKVGLPYMDFFIWGDDAEYTMRIKSYGFDGYLIPNSIVTHHNANSAVDPFSELSIKSIKMKYGLRNFIYVNNLRNRIVFKSRLRGIFSSTYVFSKIIKKRFLRDRLKFIKELPILIYIFISGMLFKPRE